MVRFTLLLFVCLSLVAPFAGGCAHEVAHSERDRSTSSGSVHEESTTYRNPDGTTKTETVKSRNSN
jgi:hypothetical protein